MRGHSAPSRTRKTHMERSPEPEYFPVWMLDDLLTQVFFVAGTTLSQCSTPLSYLRIFTTRDMKWAIWSSLTLVICTGLACLLVVLFTCTPISASWPLAELPTAKCINQPLFSFAEAGLFIIIDFLDCFGPDAEAQGAAYADQAENWGRGDAGDRECYVHC